MPELFEILQDAVHVAEDSSGNIVVMRPEAKFLIINQDEKIHQSNDVQKW